MINQPEYIKQADKLLDELAKIMDGLSSDEDKIGLLMYCYGKLAHSAKLANVTVVGLLELLKHIWSISIVERISEIPPFKPTYIS